MVLLVGPCRDELAACFTAGCRVVSLFLCLRAEMKDFSDGVFQSCFVCFVSKNIQTETIFKNLNIVYLAVFVGVIAAGQLVQTGQDSKID